MGLTVRLGWWLGARTRWLTSWSCLCACVLWVGCAAHEDPLPPVPPPLEDLSTWASPTLVQPLVPAPPVPQAPKEKLTSAEQVFDYAPGVIFSLPVSIGAPLDIVLQKGEQIRNIIGGDRQAEGATQTPRLEVREGADGMGDTLRHHLFLTAAHPGMSTGLIVTTTARTYLLTCKSVGKSPIRTVRWRYPAEPLVVKPPEPGLLPDPAQPKLYHTGYDITVTHTPIPDWSPRYVVDDGRKTYIVYPEVSLFETVPMVRLIGPGGPQLVNARQFLNVVILDQLAPRVELRLGLGINAEIVTIMRGAAMRTMACPADPACPVWPTAAHALARKGASVTVTPPGAAPPPPLPPPPDVVPHSPGELRHPQPVPETPEGATP